MPGTAKHVSEWSSGGEPWSADGGATGAPT